jgi:protein TonB
MKKPILILLFMTLAGIVKAQSTDTTSHVNPPKQIFSAVQSVPEFPGGIHEFYKYISSNVKYHGNAHGKVIIRFVVEADGSVSTITVIQGIDKDADAECVRVIANSPNWKPAIQNSRPVRVQITVPINF